MSSHAIDKYYTSVQKIKDWGGSHYKLGNRSALEWVLDQYKEKKPSDPTIAEKFNTYRPATAGKFADYKEKVTDLLKRVTTVSVGTIVVLNEMRALERFS